MLAKLLIILYFCKVKYNLFAQLYALEQRIDSIEKKIGIKYPYVLKSSSYFQDEKATANVGNDFFLPLITNSNAKPVYSSSRPYVAEIDAQTGVVKCLHEGYTTITATLPVTDNYFGSIASYELYVSPNSSSPIIINGVECVDLALPSGNLWTKESVGIYDIECKKVDVDYYSYLEYDIIDKAEEMLNEPYKSPSLSDLEELYSNTEVKNGKLVSKINGMSLSIDEGTTVFYYPLKTYESSGDLYFNLVSYYTYNVVHSPLTGIIFSSSPISKTIIQVFGITKR